MTGAIILAAGRGARLGGTTPKGLQRLARKQLFEYSLGTVHNCAAIDRVVLVVPASEHKKVSETLDRATHFKLEAIVIGGDSRMDSVVEGIGAFTTLPEWIAVHDAARPLATSDLFEGVVESARKHGGAIAATPVTDTLKRAANQNIVSTVDRSQLWRAQTPQAFGGRALLDALTHCRAQGIDVTDDAQALEQTGHTVHIVECASPNPKITTAADWKHVEHLLSANQ